MDFYINSSNHAQIGHFSEGGGGGGSLAPMDL